MSLLIGNGDGLSASYYNGLTSINTSAALTRIDKTLDFNWHRGSPDPSISNTNFSARWSGKVQAESSGSYNFYTNSDDGIRLWVNGKQLVNNWTDHAATQNKGTIALVSGQKYDIKVDYYQRAGDATAQLSWESKGIIKQIIPVTQLYSNDISAPNPIAIIPLPAPVSIPVPIAIVPIVLPVQNSFDYAFHDSDRGVPNDAHPAGVPHSYSWYESSAQPGWGNSPRTDWHAATALGAVYAVEGWNPQSAPNTRVQLRDDQLWLLLKSTGKWYQAQSPTIQGGAFRSDFAGNAGKGVTTKDESANGGGISVTADQFYNFHFWSGQRANIDPNDIKGVYSVFQARLVQDDLTKPDDRASAHYLAGGGGDYWRSQDAGWASDWSNNGGINGGRMKFVTNNWGSYSMNTLSAEEMIANSPPLTLTVN